MNKQIESLKATRGFLLRLIADLSVEDLNKIPHGFNNNIIWNLAHLIASQQGVCYKRAGLNLTIEESFFTAYKPDTKPESFVEHREVERVKELLVSTIDGFEADLKKGLFRDYPSWTTRYGVELNTINDALTFLPFHEGFHLGYIMALKRVVKNS